MSNFSFARKQFSISETILPPISYSYEDGEKAYNLLSTLAVEHCDNDAMAPLIDRMAESLGIDLELQGNDSGELTESPASEETDQ